MGEDNGKHRELLDGGTYLLLSPTSDVSDSGERDYLTLTCF